ncbi:MAG: hypothetical protein GPJ50_03365 [Candidatus Heimdallarchaeota archaeon]|nr:hypothetical protein [Candidatus Heimdallarchaeota archaeon]
MELDEIKQLDAEGEREQFLPVPSHGGLDTAKFELDDVKECFAKPALIRDFIYLVGGVAVHGKGNDVDLVIRGEDLSEAQKDALLFRLYRAFSEHFDIPYDETPEHLHITFNDVGAFTSNVKLFDLAITPSNDLSVHEMEGLTLAKSTDDWIVYGYGSINVIDLEGDEIALDTLKEMWKELQKTPRKFWNVMNEHEGIQVGEILLEWKEFKTQVDDNGFFVIVKLRKDIEAAQRIWAAIHAENEEERIKSFSIHIEYPGGVSNCTERTCDENRCWRRITKARFLEVSFTKSPANPLCLLKPATQSDTNSKEMPSIMTS